MTETNECLRCDRPARDAGYVCDTCLGELERALGDVAWLADELETTITRQRSAGTEGGSRSADRGLPWHEKASDARRVLHGLLVSWVRFCDEEDVRGKPQWHPTDRLQSLSRWLLHCLSGLAIRDIAGEAIDEITDAVAECERIVFWKRRARVYLGRCDQRVEDESGVTLIEVCTGDVYADEGSAVGHCLDCEQGVTVAIRKGELNKQLDDRLCTAAEIARLATYLGLDQPRERVRNRVNQWHKRRRIVPSGRSEDDHPLFRYGDVKPMLYAEFGRDAG